ncbi:MAG: LysR family transcriptional regulator substrate-binding protein [Acidaminococcaceae bacterium]
MANAPLLQEQRFETLQTKQERLCALFHKDSPWLSQQQEDVTLEALEDVPLCLSRGCSELFLNVCSDSQLYPKILSINTTKTSTKMWARQKVGVAIVPVGAGETFTEDLVCKVIQDERLYLNKTLSVVKDRPLSAVARNFLNFYHQHS